MCMYYSIPKILLFVDLVALFFHNFLTYSAILDINLLIYFPGQERWPIANLTHCCNALCLSILLGIFCHISQPLRTSTKYSLTVIGIIRSRL